MYFDFWRAGRTDGGFAYKGPGAVVDRRSSSQGQGSQSFYYSLILDDSSVHLSQMVKSVALANG
jgi:hypothetical protein